MLRTITVVDERAERVALVLAFLLVGIVGVFLGMMLEREVIEPWRNPPIPSLYITEGDPEFAEKCDTVTARWPWVSRASGRVWVCAGNQWRTLTEVVLSEP